MNIERDKFLTEQMGECWHESTGVTSGNNVIGFTDCSCGKWGREDGCGYINNNFSTPDGFFKLWNWAQKQKWWALFCAKLVYTPKSNPEAIDYDRLFPEDMICPDRFADAVYKFLKRENKC